jgi:hypothetical protein
MVPELITGLVVSVSISSGRPDLPTTQIEVQTASGELRMVTTPGSNGRPPVVISGVPSVEPGEHWEFRVRPAPIGQVPVGLGASMARLDGPVAPPWAVNGLVYPPEKRPLEFYIGQSTSGTTGSSELGEIRSIEIVAEAMAAWSAVGCSDFVFELVGTSEHGFSDDGLNIVSWEEEEWVWGEGVLGMTATRFEAIDGLPSPAGADILLNGADFVWVDGPGDLYTSPATVSAGSILTHELGHVAGMDHNMTDVAATMFFAYISGDWQATLSGDDHRGLCQTYPAGVEACSTDADCAVLDANGMSHFCTEIDGISVCDERRDPVGSFCARTVFNCAEACIFTVPQATDGYCSTRCESDDECEGRYTCGAPETAFLYDAPTEEGKQLCLRPDEPEDTGRPGQDTAQIPADTGLSAGDTAPPAMSGKESTEQGCSCSSSPKTETALLFCIAVLAGRRRTRHPRGSS